MKIRTYFQIGIFLFFSSLIIAQSDYRITQEFKSRQRSFEIAIEYAKTVEELNKIKKEIYEFKNEFKGNKELLNNALYPANYESSFVTLDKKIQYTNKKLFEISGLNTKVSKLESDYGKATSELSKLSGEINSLRNSNSRLMSELKAFKTGYGGSKDAVDSLNNLVAQLREGITKRDTLIKEIMDNIFTTAEHRVESLNDAEKMGLRTQVQGTSLIDNISNLINDNIEFLDASLFNPEDLTLLKDEFVDFEQRWSHFGPKLFDIYSNDEKNKEKLADIDTLMSGWNESINLSAWKAVKEVFSSNNIEIETFSNGLEFENNVLSYINNEIAQGNTTAEVQKDQKYVFFADRSWNDVFKTEWMPLLISNNLISTDQISTIENKLAEWKDSLSGSKSYLIYGLILILAIIIIASMIMINKKNKKQSADSVEVEEVEVKEEIVENKNSSSDIDENEEFIDDK